VDGDHLGDAERLEIRHAPEILDLVLPVEAGGGSSAEAATRARGRAPRAPRPGR
jgi:hypothetical protein